MKAPIFRDNSNRWALVEGDSLQLLAGLPDQSVDAVITDPPYGLGFAGHTWDRPASASGSGPAAAFTAWTTRWAAECRRILKPGGHLLAFGAPRTFHRLVCGIEDGGLEIRDVVMWLYGSGVPKSRRLPGGLGTALKPAYEPVLLARAPLAGTVAATLAGYGTGGLDIATTAIGGRRWPANLALSHGVDCQPAGCEPDCPVALLDRHRPDVQPSRFFYAAKASHAERNAGCQQLPQTVGQVYSQQKPRRPAANLHPTVKPVAVMQWLVRLVCPPGGVVLDPFAGSGTTGVATLAEERRFFGLEREGAYVDIACARLAHAARQRRVTD